MSKRQHISYLNRIISLLLAIYILNFSIDSRDANPDAIAEDLSFNDIESFYEFVLEDVFGIENAVDEYDERDEEDGGSVVFKKTYITSSFEGIVYPIKIADEPQKFSPYYQSAFASTTIEIDAPPPKA